MMLARNDADVAMCFVGAEEKENFDDEALHFTYQASDEPIEDEETDLQEQKRSQQTDFPCDASSFDETLEDEEAGLEEPKETQEGAVEGFWSVLEPLSITISHYKEAFLRLQEEMEAKLSEIEVAVGEENIRRSMLLRRKEELHGKMSAILSYLRSESRGHEQISQ